MLLLWFVQPAGAAAAQVVHAQQRAVPAAAAPTEVVAIATGQGVRAVTPVTASAVVSTTLSPVQSQTRSLVTQVTQGTASNTLLSKESIMTKYSLLFYKFLKTSVLCPAAGMQLPQGKPLTQAHLQMLRQQQLQQQQQAASPQIKGATKSQVNHLHLSHGISVLITALDVCIFEQEQPVCL